MDTFDLIARTNICNDRRWSHACLSLHVPGAPDPDPILKYLREQFSASQLATTRPKKVPFLKELGRLHLFGMTHNLPNTLTYLKREGDAQWVERLGVHLFSSAEARSFSSRIRSAGAPGGPFKIRKRFLGYNDSNCTRSWAHTRDQLLRSRRTERTRIEDRPPLR